MPQSRLYAFIKDKPDIDVLVVKDDKEAQHIEDVSRYVGYQTFVLPDFRANYGDDLRSYQDEIFKINKVLAQYFNEPKRKLLITPIHTLNYPQPKAKLLTSTHIEFGETVNLTAFKEQLLSWGYTFVDIVEDEGEVSFRGDIIDIFPLNNERPYRISLFDDECESIREFDSLTQKSIPDELEQCEITPAFFALDASTYESMLTRIETMDSDSFSKDFNALGFWLLGDLAEDLLEGKKAYALADYGEEIEDIDTFYQQTLDTTRLKNISILPKNNAFKELISTDPASLLAFHPNKKHTILYKSEGQLKQYFDIHIDAKLKQGELVVNIITPDEIILSLNKPEKKKRRRKSKIILDELNSGDYVVHEDYGVGIFNGLVQKTVLGTTREFVEIAYQGDDKLFVPVENIAFIDRYMSDSGSLAVLDKLGKGSFGKLKAKAQEKLFEMAREIVEIAAKRELIKTDIINTDLPEITLFQNDAGFVYTNDQDKSIKEILSDLNSPKAMDRLLSGDVGFGKTEVAMNAIFASVKNGKQAAFIVPTTLLSFQHTKSVKERFDKYGISVARYDRFTTAKEKTAIKKALVNGTLDVLIGTHGVMDVEFKNLFLVILDEEHKFGVKQKEKLKNFKETTHVLSMSATPIPRSLNMALSSIKTYSVLMTAPSEREDIRTYVKEYQSPLTKEAIMRETRRGGQVFYIHNRIATIESKKKDLEKLIPGLRVLSLHSKISPAVTEKEMMRFENGEYDLLVSTSIIESGIHIPNVNTIIIEDANNFGIADLHQLRGRVGRGSRQGYCYYMVEDKDALSEQAVKRLLALESNSFLGSGATLAYHDLEIRGGGNLVGEKQSGHIKNIGYSLYLRMLEDAINALMNKTIIKKKEVSINLNVTAFLNADTINEDRIRLEIYRRLSNTNDVKEVYEIQEELEDRFGSLDEITKQFLKVMVIKIKASKKEIIKISNFAQHITIEYENKEEKLSARSKDDDDILDSILGFLKG